MKLTDLRFTHSKTPFLFLFFSVFNTAADQAPAPQYLKLGRELSRPVAAVIILLVFVFFIMVFLFVYLRHYLELNAATDAALRAAAAGSDRCGMCRGLDPDVIRTFPVVAHSEIKGTKFAKWSLECAVCLSEFCDCETLRLLPNCGHAFHPACIDAWLASSATCPSCRAMLAAAPEIPAPEFVAVAVVDRSSADGESEAVGSSSEMEFGGSVGGEKPGDVAAIY